MSINPHDINTIREAALLMEDTDLTVARDLMQIAHQQRPDGLFIKKKLAKYNFKLEKLTKSEEKVSRLMEKGELAIVPVGFRCHTSQKLFKKLRIEQASLPFDNGFFPPSAIAKVLRKGKVDLRFPESTGTHKVCLKNERFMHDTHGKGIKFETSSYEEINEHVKSKTQEDINRYLDRSFGYYTLDVEHEYVLAHYNWHTFASEKKSKGIYETAKNIENTNAMLNKRLERMVANCRKAKHIVLPVGEFQQYSYMMIDEKVFHIHDLSELTAAAEEKFGVECKVCRFPEISTADKLLQKLNLI